MQIFSYNPAHQQRVILKCEIWNHIIRNLNYDHHHSSSLAIGLFKETLKSVKVSTAADVFGWASLIWWQILCDECAHIVENLVEVYGFDKRLPPFEIENNKRRSAEDRSKKINSVSTNTF